VKEKKALCKKHIRMDSFQFIRDIITKAPFFIPMIDVFAEKHSLPKYRIVQFNEAFYRKSISSYSELTTWPKELREALDREVPFSRIKAVSKIVRNNRGDTLKIVFERTVDHKTFETVLMRHKDGRNTVCVSCMSGCPVGCVFCATGTLGFQANLTAEEIIDQVLFFARTIKPDNQTISNVVFMGMGEPMLNLEQVEKAITILTDPTLMGMSDRRITVSTSGYVPQLRLFLEHGYTGRLAISLHAPSQKLREKLMPTVARAFPIPELLAVVDEFTQKTNRRVSFEYMLISGVNDSEDHAAELASLLNGKLAHVNLIPYNPIEGIPYKRSSPKAVELFSRVLTNLHIPHTIRVTMGDDIAAACGQLAGKK
jgi:23S rRNA (adenine2503-C2)-methyltransferase